MDAFDRFEGTDTAQGDAFDRFTTPEQDESWWKSTARTALQIPQGILDVTPYGLWTGLWQALALGETELGVDELQRLKDIGEREGIPFDEQAYEEARQNSLASVPTISNIGSTIESYTGIPLEPKTRLQKGIRFASSAAKAIPGPQKAVQLPGSQVAQHVPGFRVSDVLPIQKSNLGYAFRGTDVGLPRPVLGAGVALAKEGLVEAGVPEPFADIASFLAIKPVSPSGSHITIGKKKKPSGLTERQYMGLEVPKEVSKGTINKINTTLEDEFKAIANNIIINSPIGETYTNLANDVKFKQDAKESFKEVEKLAEALPKTFETSRVKNDLQAVISNKKNKGLTPSEFDKRHNSFIQEFIKDTPDGTFTTKDIVAQYRKNNGQLAEAFEPGQSFAYNRAKREALLDYNRSLANMIETEFPGSEFSKVFKETNKRWADINNAESISNYLENVFPERANTTKRHVNYENAKQLFEKDGMNVPFKKALGQEGYEKFTTLINDLMSTKRAMKLLGQAEELGFSDLAKMAGSFIVHPNVAAFHQGWKMAKRGYNYIYEMALNQPKITVVWDRGINAMKAGNFKQAQKDFQQVKAVFDGMEAKQSQPNPQGATINVNPIGNEIIEVTKQKVAAQSQEPKKIVETQKPPIQKPSPKQIENKTQAAKQLEHKPKEKAIEQPIKETPIFEDEGIQAIFDELEAENTNSSKSEIEKAKLQEIYDDVAQQIREKQQQNLGKPQQPKKPAATPKKKESPLIENIAEEQKKIEVAPEKPIEATKQKGKIVLDHRTSREPIAKFVQLMEESARYYEELKPISKKIREYELRNGGFETRFRRHVQTSTIDKLKAKESALRQKQIKKIEDANNIFENVQLDELQKKLLQDIGDGITFSYGGTISKDISEFKKTFEESAEKRFEKNRQAQEEARLAEERSIERHRLEKEKERAHPNYEKIQELKKKIEDKEFKLRDKHTYLGQVEDAQMRYDLEEMRKELAELRKEPEKPVEKPTDWRKLQDEYKAEEKAKEEQRKLAEDKRVAESQEKYRLEQEKVVKHPNHEKIKVIEDKIQSIKNALDHERRGYNYPDQIEKHLKKISDLEEELRILKKKPLEKGTLAEQSDKAYEDLREYHKNLPYPDTLESLNGIMEKFDVLEKLKNAELKAASADTDVSEVVKMINTIKNTRKEFTKRLNEVKNKSLVKELEKASDFSEDDIRKSLQEIIRLRKLKEAVKGTSIEAKQQRRHLEKQISDWEHIFHNNKKAKEAAVPDLRKVQKPDVSKHGLEKQRDFIIDAIEKAQKNPPATEKVTIEVPGDGVFKIWNIFEVLEEFKHKIEKKWPVTQSKPSQAPRKMKLEENQMNIFLHNL